MPDRSCFSREETGVGIPLLPRLLCSGKSSGKFSQSKKGTTNTPVLVTSLSRQSCLHFLMRLEVAVTPELHDRSLPKIDNNWKSATTVSTVHNTLIILWKEEESRAKLTQPVSSQINSMVGQQLSPSHRRARPPKRCILTQSMAYRQRPLAVNIPSWFPTSR
jgi:hypothetical protein